MAEPSANTECCCCHINSSVIPITPSLKEKNGWVRDGFLLAPEWMDMKGENESYS